MSHYQSYLNAVSKANKTDPSSPPFVRKHQSSLSTTPTAPYTPPSIHTSVPREDTSSVKSVPLTPASTVPSIAAAAAATQAAPTTQPPAASSTTTHQSSSSLSRAQISAALQSALMLQTTATTVHSKRPFAALLLGPDKSSILLTHFSISHVQHAETELARLASIHYSPAYLADCTLVSTWEPCAMCAGTIYWSGIGRLLYAASEEKLKELTGDGNGENMTMNLPCRAVFKAGQRQVEVIGPVTDDGWEQRVVQESGKWWKEHQQQHQPKTELSNGSAHVHGQNINDMERSSVATTWTGEQNGVVGEDGEYKADLDIDWMR